MAAHNPDAETGNNLASWTAIIICFVGFVIGGIAVVMAEWSMLWVGIVLVAISPVVGLVMSKMGHGEESARAKRELRAQHAARH